MEFLLVTDQEFTVLNLNISFQLKPQIPSRGVIAKVCPTKNNGFAELVTIKETKHADKAEPMLWFNFQKLKYVWDPEKSQFRGIEFPIHETYDQYVKWKGHQNENDILVAEKTYGKNLMEMVVPEFLELFTERATAPFVSLL